LRDHQWAEVPKAEITDRLNEGKLKILVCTDAASEGLNLQSAGALVNYDLPWNPSKVEQRIGRIDRIGQKQHFIAVFNLFLDDSVDMRVYDVLQERCGLFEDFVGKMQPVLALARSGLKNILAPREEEKLIQEMRLTAREVEKDETIGAEFAEAEAVDTSSVIPTITVSDLELSIRSLQKASGKIKVRSTGEKQWSLRGLERKAIKVTTDLEALERDKHLLPLSAGTEIIDRIRETLPLPSRSPLVIAERISGAYRCAEARWIHGEDLITITTFAQLQELINAWDGKPVSPTLIHKAYEEAEQSAFERMMQIDFECSLTVREGLENQVKGASLRLRRELGRTLRCLGSDNLNDYFRKQVRAENSLEGRYHQALRRLGQYPEWTVEEIQEYERYVGELTEEQRNGRIRLGSEIEAALKDPRWEAEKQLRKKAKLNICFDFELQAFNREAQQRFKSSLAKMLSTSPTQIDIIKVLPGSTIVRLEMDEDDATQLLSMYMSQNPSLQTLPKFKIPGVPQLSGITSTSVVNRQVVAATYSEMQNNEVVSLCKQIKEHHRNILRIQEKRAEFIDPRQAPMDLDEQEQWLQRQIEAKLDRLKELGVDYFTLY
jgi:hypothetical protein